MRCRQLFQRCFCLLLLLFGQLIPSARCGGSRSSSKHRHHFYINKRYRLACTSAVVRGAAVSNRRTFSQSCAAVDCQSKPFRLFRWCSMDCTMQNLSFLALHRLLDAGSPCCCSPFLRLLLPLRAHLLGWIGCTCQQAQQPQWRLFVSRRNALD